MILRPQTKTLYTVAPEHSHSLSLRRVLYAKVLRYVDKAPAATLIRISLRTGCAVALFLAFLAPQVALGICASLIASKWLLGACGACAFLYYRAILRVSRKIIFRRRGGSAKVFHGVPILELADYLLQAEAFPMTAMDALHISQPQHVKIARELEGHGVLIRGESNARILQPISRVELVDQLENNFPLVWSPHEKLWLKRRDSFAEYLLSKELKEKRETEHIEKRARKLQRIEKKIQDLQNPFTLRELTYPIQTA